jgi:large subunit ribosomal protein L21
LTNVAERLIFASFKIEIKIKEADSMYAVVTSGGKQYKVEEGDILRVEKIPGQVGGSITFDRVLMVSDGENVNIGRPVLDEASVEGHIVEQGKAKKIIVFKFKRRKRYRRKQGHRQQYTAVKIDRIKAKGLKARKEAESEAKDQKPVAKETKAGLEAKKPVAKEAPPKKKVAQKAGTQSKTKKPAPKKAATKKTETKKTAAPKTAAKKAAAKTKKKAE